MSGILFVVENKRLLGELTRELRREGCIVFCVRSLRQAPSVLRTGQDPHCLFVRVPNGDRSVQEMRNEVARRLPGWSIELADATDEVGGGQDVGCKGARSLLN